MKRDGGPAFPTADNDAMTLRDYFAGQALAALFSGRMAVGEYKAYAIVAYNLADAMLAERERE